MITYFELNNWFPERDYPNVEPFLSWMEDDLKQSFRNYDFVEQNELIVVAGFLDMSLNYCVTAKTDWVMKMCPSLLTEFRQFLRFPDEHGYIYGRYDCPFLEYDPNDIGVHWWDFDNCCWEK